MAREEVLAMDMDRSISMFCIVESGRELNGSPEAEQMKGITRVTISPVWPPFGLDRSRGVGMYHTLPRSSH